MEWTLAVLPGVGVVALVVQAADLELPDVIQAHTNGLHHKSPKFVQSWIVLVLSWSCWMAAAGALDL